MKCLNEQTWMRGGIWSYSNSCGAGNTEITPIWERRWRPQDPACHLQRWGRQRVTHLCWKPHGVSSFLTQVCHGSPLLLKGFFVVSLFGGLCRYNLNFCHDNQPPAGGREVSSGPCSTWTGVQKEHPWPLLFTEKKGGRILARWFGRFVVESLEDFWKDEVPFGLFTGKLYTILFWGIWKAHTLQRFQASLQEEYSDAFIEFL